MNKINKFFKFIKDKYSENIRNKFWLSISNLDKDTIIEFPIKLKKHFNSFYYFDKDKILTPFGVFKYKVKW